MNGFLVGMAMIAVGLAAIFGFFLVMEMLPHPGQLTDLEKRFYTFVIIGVLLMAVCKPIGDGYLEARKRK